MSQTIIAQTTASIQTSQRIIDLTDSIPDITANLIHDSEHYQLPSDIFENAVLEAINDLIDDFADCPDRYLKPKHKQQIDKIAAEYLQDEG